MIRQFSKGLQYATVGTAVWLSVASAVAAEPQVISAAEWRRGVAFETPLGVFRLEPDRSYYVDRGILKSADPQAGYLRLLAGTASRTVQLFYLAVPDNDLAQSLVTPDESWLASEQVPEAIFRTAWTQGFRVSHGDTWSLFPVSYLQGNALGDFIFDISPGYPTSGRVTRTREQLQCHLEFREPVYHFIRLGDDLSPEAFDTLYSASVNLVIEYSRKTIVIDTTVRLGRSVNHHNGLVFAAVDMGDLPYTVQFDGATRQWSIARDMKQFRYVQEREDGTVVMIEHGVTPDRRYDEGPYYEVERLPHFPAGVQLTSKRAALRLDLGTFRDLEYRRGYVDFFGTAFPRNAMIANYTQFGETTPRFVAFISYTGIGMGWIPTLLLGGRYHMRYEVTMDYEKADDRVSDLRRVDNARVRRQYAGVAPKVQPVDTARRDRLEGLITDVAKRNHRRVGQRWTELWRCLDRGGRQDREKLLVEVVEQWEALDWEDWRTRWLARELIDWSRSWGRSDAFERTRLCWESLQATRVLDAFQRRKIWGLVKRSRNWFLQSASTEVAMDLSTTEGVFARLQLPELFACLFEYACSDQAEVSRVWSGARIESILRELCTETQLSDEGSYVPAADLVGRVKLSDAVSTYYLLLLAHVLGETIGADQRAGALGLIAVRLDQMDQATMREWFPFSRFLAYPECMTLIERERPELLRAVPRSEEAHRPWSSFRCIANFGLGGQAYYFAQTVYGSSDLQASAAARRADCETIRELCEGAGAKTASLYARSLLLRIK